MWRTGQSSGTGGHGNSGRPSLSAFPTVTPGLRRRISPIALRIPLPGRPPGERATPQGEVLGLTWPSFDLDNGPQPPNCPPACTGCWRTSNLPTGCHEELACDGQPIIECDVPRGYRCS